MSGAVHRVMVSFEDEAAGVEELTWGQREIYAAMVAQQSWFPIVVIRALSAATTIDDVAAEVRFCLGRYDAMRTRLVFGADGEPRQSVAGHGELAVEVFEAGDGDPVEIAAEVARRYGDDDFDFARDWPVRIGLVLRHGRPSHLATVYCHLVLDASARAMLTRDLTERENGTTGRPRGRGMAPAELARWERGDEARAASDASLRYWDRLLRAVPARRFVAPGDPREPRYWEAEFRSRALHLALRAISPRAAGATAPLLAIFAVALHRVTGTDPVLTQVVVSNRFRTHLADVLAPVNQTGLFVLEVGDTTCAEALRRGRGRAMSAYKSAYYDPRRQAELVARVSHERGEDVDIACFFNDRRMTPAVDDGPTPTEADVRAARADTTFAWRTRTDQPSERLFLHVEDVADTLCLTAWTDTHRFAPAHLEAVLREMEVVAVTAAFAPTTPTSAQP